MGQQGAVVAEAAKALYKREHPTTKELYTIWSAGRSDGGALFGLLVGNAKLMCGDRIAADLYEMHAMAEDTYDRARCWGRAKEWAYTLAASYARSARLRYALDWGRQAAKDGVCLALWPEDRVEIAMPTCEARAEQFGVGVKKYARVRAHVKAEAKALVAEFEGFLGDVIAAERN